MKRIWDADELAAVWSLKLDELNLLKTKPARNHLGFVVQLKHYLLNGRFLNNRSDISDPPSTLQINSICKFQIFNHMILQGVLASGIIQYLYQYPDDSTGTQ